MCGRPSIELELVDFRQYQGALSLLPSSGQPGVAGDIVIDMYIKGESISLPDAGESAQGISELHFTMRPVSNYDITLVYMETCSLKTKELQQLNSSGQSSAEACGWFLPWRSS